MVAGRRDGFDYIATFEVRGDSAQGRSRRTSQSGADRRPGERLHVVRITHRHRPDLIEPLR
jgi:hypothetical protein